MYYSEKNVIIRYNILGEIKMNVYDFDNTIYRGESGVDLFLYYFKKDPSLIKSLPWAIECITKYKRCQMTMEQVLDKFADKVVSYGAPIENFEDDVVDFWDKNCFKIKSFYLRQRRDDDIIISACPDIIIGEICRRLNIKNYIATETEPGTKKLIRFCYRDNKVAAFREKYPDAVIDNLYTDSYNDQPLIDIAKNAYLVKGKQVTKIK